MRRNISVNQPTSIDFYDGYLFKFLQDIAAGGDRDEAGLYSYYKARVERKLGGLVDYEGALASYLLSEFPGDTRFVHAGIGIGTTTSLLASMGRRTTGIEAEPRRMALARRLRASLCAMWPDVSQRYTLIEGFFPDVIGTGETPVGPDTVVFFTNFVGGPSVVAAERILDSLHFFGHAIVELRMFARTRDEPEERAGLLRSILDRGYCDEGDILGDVPGMYFRRFRTHNAKVRYSG